MAKNDTIQGAAPEPAAAKVDTVLYSADELAAVARSKFGTTPEVVRVALKTAGAERATVDCAADIIKKFLSREVK